MLLARFVDPWIPIGLAAIIVSAAIVSAGRPDVRELFRPSRSRILIGLLGAAIMLAATYGFFPLVARRVPALALETGNLYATFLTGRWTVAILLFVIPVIVAEELMWRGAFQEWIAQRLPASRLAIIVLAAAGYAIAHLPLGSPLLVAIAFLCGLYSRSAEPVGVSGGTLAPLGIPDDGGVTGGAGGGVKKTMRGRRDGGRWRDRNPRGSRRTRGRGARAPRLSGSRKVTHLFPSASGNFSRLHFVTD